MKDRGRTDARHRQIRSKRVENSRSKTRDRGNIEVKQSQDRGSEATRYKHNRGKTGMTCSSIECIIVRNADRIFSRICDEEEAKQRAQSLPRYCCEE